MIGIEIFVMGIGEYACHLDLDLRPAGFLDCDAAAVWRLKYLRLSRVVVSWTLERAAKRHGFRDRTFLKVRFWCPDAK
jgi:hypothetical protein